MLSTGVGENGQSHDTPRDKLGTKHYITTVVVLKMTQDRSGGVDSVAFYRSIMLPLPEGLVVSHQIYYFLLDMRAPSWNGDPMSRTTRTNNGVGDLA